MWPLLGQWCLRRSSEQHWQAQQMMVLLLLVLVLVLLLGWGWEPQLEQGLELLLLGWGWEPRLEQGLELEQGPRLEQQGQLAPEVPPLQL